jgi:hypothetical protein
MIAHIPRLTTKEQYGLPTAYLIVSGTTVLDQVEDSIGSLGRIGSLGH